MRKYTEEQLRDLINKNSKKLENSTHNDLIEWVEENFGENFITASNMQDAVLIDVVTKTLKNKINSKNLNILFLETGYHFPETIGTRDAVEAIYDINLVNVEPEISIAEQEKKFGANLFASDPNQCCFLRKVLPLEKTLINYDAWITGIRRVEAPSRANSPKVSFDEKFKLVKINPIVDWDDEKYNEYIHNHNILVNPLVDEGYLSIGCKPCTAKVLAGQDARSGRWSGFNKTECGLHTS